MLSQTEFNTKIPQLLRESADKFPSPQDYPLYIVVKADGTIAAETFRTARAVEMLIGDYERCEMVRRDADWYSKLEAQSDDHLYKNYLIAIETLNRVK